jgi:hypothetical protein
MRGLPVVAVALAFARPATADSDGCIRTYVGRVAPRRRGDRARAEAGAAAADRGAVERQDRSFDLGAPLVALTAADLDGDGKPELYAVTSREVVAIALPRARCEGARARRVHRRARDARRAASSVRRSPKARH